MPHTAQPPPAFQGQENNLAAGVATDADITIISEQKDLTVSPVDPEKIVPAGKKVLMGTPLRVDSTDTAGSTTDDGGDSEEEEGVESTATTVEGGMYTCFRFFSQQIAGLVIYNSTTSCTTLFRSGRNTSVS